MFVGSKLFMLLTTKCKEHSKEEENCKTINVVVRINRFRFKNL